jgi:FADH2 O2-dependent halogenase
MLRFNNGITSAGAALTTAGVTNSVVASGFSRTALWDQLLDTLPSVRQQFANARAVAPWVHAPQLAFRTTHVAGPNWALLPSAAGVIDPLLSTGFPLTLLGIHRLLNILDAGPTETTLRDYERVTLAELDATEHLVAALYASMIDVPLFKRLTLLYFAAASFSEAARRLNRAHLAPGFLLHAHPAFGPELHACCDAALRLGAAQSPAEPQQAAREALFARIDRAIEPFDIVGLLDRSRRDWHPARAEDLIANASRLHATAAEIELLLERCGFSPSRASG